MSKELVWKKRNWKKEKKSQTRAIAVKDPFSNTKTFNSINNELHDERLLICSFMTAILLQLILSNATYHHVQV